MDGEFTIEATAGISKGVAGGNIILQAASQTAALAAARKASDALANLPGIITPFPGGVCRSGSKVGSKYKALLASTSEAYCPTLRNQVKTELVAGVECAYEIVIDGVDEPSGAAAMRTAIEAAAGEGVLAIGAGNYGGKLGKYPIRLHDLFDCSRHTPCAVTSQPSNNNVNKVGDRCPQLCDGTRSVPATNYGIAPPAPLLPLLCGSC
jgi:formylmethanofuran--tetrahydromethanopterin N-formyltransferase